MITVSHLRIRHTALALSPKWAIRLRWSIAGIFCIALAACGGGGSSGSSGGGESGSTTTYTVTASAGSGGSISPSHATVTKGKTTSFTVTPGNGYATASVSGCGGSLSGNLYTTGSITGNCTITAAFVKTYTVTATAGAGGSITPNSVVVKDGSTTDITVTPDVGYAIDSVSGCSGTLSGTTYTTGPVKSDCAVSASFVVTNQWAWVSGGSGVNAQGVYGTSGSASTSNIPGARIGATSWTGADGKFWLFGGNGYDSVMANPDILNDLWQYDPATGEWTWMSGQPRANYNGNYGTLLVPAPTNMPGARWRPVSWTDQSGQLWLFGGQGNGDTQSSNVLNDLWVYNPGSGEWTWMSGSKTVSATGVYGTKGTPDTGNVPGARYLSSSWTDAAGHFWLFGGFGLDSTGAIANLLNDLWEYDPGSNEWTWMAGSETVGATPDYGSEGVPAATNVPGPRSRAMTWTDANGNLWLFGGHGVDAHGATSSLNDLWEYDIGTGQWTWIGGSDTDDGKGVYGTQGTADAANIPGARIGATAWSDPTNGRFWLFGGTGVDSEGNTGELNDIWVYDVQTNEWTWMGGSKTANASGSYGTEGAYADTNIPGARDGASSKWVDANGHLWLFGGNGYDAGGNPGLLNDLWQYHP